MASMDNTTAAPVTTTPKVNHRAGCLQGGSGMLSFTNSALSLPTLSLESINCDSRDWSFTTDMSSHLLMPAIQVGRSTLTTRTHAKAS